MILAIPEVLLQAAKPWSTFYGHSKVAATVVTFLHIAPIVVGGGLAITFDRAALRLDARDPHARAVHLAELRTTHTVVLAALALSFLSGIALLASDLETFLPSWVFWLKMALIAALLANGRAMTRLEPVLAGPGDKPDQWRRLRRIAMTSLMLWLAITFAGVVLTNIG